MVQEIRFRRFEIGDEFEIANILKRNFLEVNIKDYEREEMEELVHTHDEKGIKMLARNCNLYVGILENKIIACGGVAKYFGNSTECTLLSIFVNPDYHSTGVGRKIIKCLEADRLFLSSKRVEVAASITACGFYEKLGYKYKNGQKKLDEHKLYIMEKYNYLHINI
ncbi:MAG: GNAT family N-acetyltransferase [Sarcina sp.]